MTIANRARQGKTPKDESFPVASRLLPASSRDAILAFYRFARHADDIADDPDIEPAEKLARLDALDAGLCGEGAQPEAAALCRAVSGTPATVEQARLLLHAFRQDARGKTYRCWSDLILYCSYSAVPVGRFLLALHEEPAAAKRPADALCTAHQILNHVQDCGDDYRRLSRIYIPTELLAEPERLGEPRATAPVRRALDACLDRVEDLLALARSLPGQLRHPALAGQAAATVTAGRRLARRLRRRDPLAERVRLTRLDLMLAGASLLGRRWL